MIRLAALALVLTGCLIPMQPAGQQPYGAQPAPAGGDATGPSSSSPSPSSSYSSPSSSPSSAPARAAEPATPQVVSVTIRGGCGQTVKVFYGEKPKYGSGTSSSVSSNSVSSHSFRPGEMMWVTDDNDNGVASVTVRADTREINVSCTGISSR